MGAVGRSTRVRRSRQRAATFTWGVTVTGEVFSVSPTRGSSTTAPLKRIRTAAVVPAMPWRSTRAKEVTSNPGSAAVRQPRSAAVMIKPKEMAVINPVITPGSQNSRPRRRLVYFSIPGSHITNRASQTGPANVRESRRKGPAGDWLCFFFRGAVGDLPRQLRSTRSGNALSLQP